MNAEAKEDYKITRLLEDLDCWLTEIRAKELQIRSALITLKLYLKEVEK